MKAKYEVLNVMAFDGGVIDKLEEVHLRRKTIL